MSSSVLLAGDVTTRTARKASPSRAILTLAAGVEISLFDHGHEGRAMQLYHHWDTRNPFHVRNPAEGLLHLDDVDRLRAMDGANGPADDDAPVGLFEERATLPRANPLASPIGERWPDEIHPRLRRLELGREYGRAVWPAARSSCRSHFT